MKFKFRAVVVNKDSGDCVKTPKSTVVWARVELTIIRDKSVTLSSKKNGASEVEERTTLLPSQKPSRQGSKSESKRNKQLMSYGTKSSSSLSRSSRFLHLPIQLGKQIYETVL